MNNCYLVQILLPKERGNGEPVSQRWFEEFLEELTDRSAARPASSEHSGRPLF
ncbi:hypothetical protein ACVWXN_000463 [Bradyrhizobium sp. i1.4.4]